MQGCGPDSPKSSQRIALDSLNDNLDDLNAPPKRARTKSEDDQEPRIKSEERKSGETEDRKSGETEDRKSGETEDRKSVETEDRKSGETEDRKSEDVSCGSFPISKWIVSDLIAFKAYLELEVIKQLDANFDVEEMSRQVGPPPRR